MSWEWEGVNRKGQEIAENRGKYSFIYIYKVVKKLTEQEKCYVPLYWEF